MIVGNALRPALLVTAARPGHSGVGQPDGIGMQLALRIRPSVATSSAVRRRPDVQNLRFSYHLAALSCLWKSLMARLWECGCRASSAARNGYRRPLHVLLSAGDLQLGPGPANLVPMTTRISSSRSSLDAGGPVALVAISVAVPSPAASVQK